MGFVVGILDKHPFEKSILYTMQNLLSYRGNVVKEGRIFHFENSHHNAFQNGGISSNLGCESNVAVAIDGVIYNAEELYACLEYSQLENAKKNNANLFLQLYILYGFKKALQMIDGAFAISLLDLNRQILFIARDSFFTSCSRR